MTITITALDGSDDTSTPARVKRLDFDVDSGNVVHQLIAPGAIAVTLVGDASPEGTLTLLYASDDSAASARALLGRSSSFSFADTDRPALDMTFVRRGRMSPVMHAELDQVWFLEVGFQEIIP